MRTLFRLRRILAGAAILAVAGSTLVGVVGATESPAAPRAFGSSGGFEAAATRRALTLAASKGPTQPPDPTQDRWLTATTPHFTLYTNGRERIADLVARNMGAMHDVILGLNPDVKPLFETPTYVLAFKDWESFWPFQLRNSGVPLDVAGLFVRHHLANYMVLVADPAYDPYHVVYHEYAHYLLATLFPSIPNWLDEGLAEYYGSLWVFPERVELGGKVDDHVSVLRRRSLLPLERLLAVTDTSADYNEQTRRGIFYAQSWALVSYLMQDEPTSLRRFARFMERVADGASQADALAEVFGRPLDDIAAGLQAYVKKGKYPKIKVSGLRVDDGRSLRPKDADPTEVLSHLGQYEVIAELGLRGAAVRHLEAALARAPEHPRATAALAYHRFLDGRFDLAQPLYEKILGRHPDDEASLFLYGLALVDRQERLAELGQGPPTDATGVPRVIPDDIVKARALLRRALGLDPMRAESYVLFGYTWRFDPGDPAEGVTALEKARTLFPRRVEVAFYLGLLLMRTDQYDRAATLFEEVRDSAQGEVAGLAGAADFNRVQVRLMEADALFAAHRFDDGRRVLEQVRATTTDPEALNNIDTTLRTLDQGEDLEALLDAANTLLQAGQFEEGAALLRRVRDRTDIPELAAQIDAQLAEIEELQHIQARLDEAIDLLNAGKVEDGVATLKQVRAQTDNPAVIAHIDELLAQVEEFRAGQRENVREYQANERNNTAIDLYEEARQLLGDGDLAAAKAKLQQVIELTDILALRRQAEEMVELIEGRE